MSAYMNRKLAGDCVRCGQPMSDADTVCCDRCRLYAAAWRQANPQRKREHDRRYREANRARVNEAANLARKKRRA